MISLLDFIHPALPGPNLTHSRWGTIWPYAGRNHGHKMRHKWPPVGSLRWPSTGGRACSACRVKRAVTEIERWSAVRLWRGRSIILPYPSFPPTTARCAEGTWAVGNSGIRGQLAVARERACITGETPLHLGFCFETSTVTSARFSAQSYTLRHYFQTVDDSNR